MKNTAFAMALPFLFSIAACSSSGTTTNNQSPDGGSPITNVACPEHCTPDPSRDSACTGSSHVGERFACACEDAFAGELQCGSDYGLIGTGKNGVCCNAHPVEQPPGSGCDTAHDCAMITCSCGPHKGAQSYSCVNGACSDEKASCGC